LVYCFQFCQVHQVMVTVHFSFILVVLFAQHSSAHTNVTHFFTYLFSQIIYQYFNFIHISNCSFIIVCI
jgi:hypothetical protein